MTWIPRVMRITTNSAMGASMTSARNSVESVLNHYPAIR
jgi:hypothetical protein